MSHTPPVTRRSFIKTTAIGAAAGTLAIRSTTGAGEGRTFTVGLIGCGGRGKGALKDCHGAAKRLGITLNVVGTADAFRNKAAEAGREHGVPEKHCFGGFDSYHKLLELKPDIVVMAPPPGFRPIHFEACVEAGAHVFMEKPVAVDPPGVRRIIAAGEKAATKGLAVVAGTQRRHQASYRRNAFAIHEGAIGKIVGGTVSWCSRVPWVRTRQAGQSDADYLANNWLNWCAMSGDHICEQHVHNLDVANWFIGRPPVAAIGFGARHQRKTGDQFDCFSVDLDYGQGCHIHSMCSQRTGCYTRVSEYFVGTEGEVWGGGKIASGKLDSITIPAFPGGNPYVQEHVDLLQSILDGKPLNEARTVADSTLVAIMGRIATYTGRLVRWSDLIANTKSPFYNLALTPTAEAFEKGTVKAPPEDVIPTPGRV